MVHILFIDYCQIYNVVTNFYSDYILSRYPARIELVQYSLIYEIYDCPILIVHITVAFYFFFSPRSWCLPFLTFLDLLSTGTRENVDLTVAIAQNDYAYPASKIAP